LILIRVGTVSCIARVSADLFQVRATGEPTDAHRRPAQLDHQLADALVGADTAAVLDNPQNVQHRLGTDTLETIIPDLTAEALQRQAVRINVWRRRSGLCVLQL
jgi:hypothetical protein